MGLVLGAYLGSFFSLSAVSSSSADRTLQVQDTNNHETQGLDCSDEPLQE